MSIMIDTRGFSAMCRDLSAISGAPMHKVILFEAGKVLEKSLASTSAMTATKIDRIAKRFIARTNTFASGGIIGQGKTGLAGRSIYPRINVSPGKGNTWWIDKNDDGRRTFYIMSGGRRWSDARWRAFQELEAERQAALKEALAQLPKIKASRGVSKASWLQIADNLSITLSGVPAYVRSARPRQGPRIDGVGRRFDNATQFFVELENRNQILINRQNGARILQRAIDGRLKFFETNLAKGAFESIASAAKKYPGVFLQAA